MGEQNGLAALGGDFAQGRQDAVDAGGVAHLAVFHRHIEIDANQHPLVLQDGGVERVKGGHGGLWKKGLAKEKGALHKSAPNF
jgi:hypothetical protein